MQKRTRPRRRWRVWLIALALLAAGCGGAGVPTDGPSDDSDRSPGVFGEAAWGEATWQ